MRPQDARVESLQLRAPIRDATAAADREVPAASTHEVRKSKRSSTMLTRICEGLVGPPHTARLIVYAVYFGPTAIYTTPRPAPPGPILMG